MTDLAIWPVLRWVLAVAAAGGATVLVLLLVNAVLTRIGRRQPPLLQGWLRVRRPLGTLVLTIALRVSFAATADPSTFRDVGLHVLLIATIVSAVWFIATLVLAWLEHAQHRVIARKGDDDRGRRRAHTQMLLIRRLVNVAFVIIGVAMVLLTFPGVEQVGATILASAGLLSVVVGIAAQTSLGNVFAGLQLAFTDAIRIGDIVEVDGTWSTVEDITLSYVVVSIWTEQHKVLPSTFFTTQPFINWSRTGDSVLGVVYFELEPGYALGTHTDSAEEVLLILQSAVEVTVGEARCRIAAGDLAVVPELVPHNVRNVGTATAKVVGFFPSGHVTATFDEAFLPLRQRVFEF